MRHHAQCGRGQFFVRLRMRRSGAGAFGRPPLLAVIDHYIDSGSGEWLIPRCLHARRILPHAASDLEQLLCENATLLCQHQVRSC